MLARADGRLADAGDAPNLGPRHPLGSNLSPNIRDGMSIAASFFRIQIDGISP
jgi:hypothetical protein